MDDQDHHHTSAECDVPPDKAVYVGLMMESASILVKANRTYGDTTFVSLKMAMTGAGAWVQNVVNRGGDVCSEVLHDHTLSSCEGVNVGSYGISSTISVPKR